MKLKYNFVTNEVADTIVAVVIGDDMDKFSGFIKMNDIGAEIFEILKNDVELDEIIKLMLQKHPESTEEEARECVTEFVDKLKAEGVVE